jgi:hypothetical protein
MFVHRSVIVVFVILDNELNAEFHAGSFPRTPRLTPSKPDRRLAERDSSPREDIYTEINKFPDTVAEGRKRRKQKRGDVSG